jgi:hypothetical protein
MHGQIIIIIVVRVIIAIKRVNNKNNNNNSNSEARIAKESRNTIGLTFENLIRSLRQLLLSDDDNNSNSNSGSDGVPVVGKVIRHGGRDPYTDFFCLRDIPIPTNHRSSTCSVRTSFDAFFRSIMSTKQDLTSSCTNNDNGETKLDSNYSPEILNPIPQILSLGQVHQTIFNEISNRIYSLLSKGQSPSSMSPSSLSSPSELYIGWYGSFL